MTRNDEDQPNPTPPLCAASQPPAAGLIKRAKEWGGGQGPEPTRYGDWELRGRCIDF